MTGRLCIVVTSVPSEGLLENGTNNYWEKKPHQPLESEAACTSECKYLINAQIWSALLCAAGYNMAMKKREKRGTSLMF